ncbi:MAG: hypothetical protein Q7W45_11305 [Bacteroidota bacterium]|nr:hypothetical protein [Bacteroidota bacterium]MDP3147088.1 hypothetical protein [Bacteroidota bacterium]
MKKVTPLELLIVLIVVLVFITSSFMAKGNDTASCLQLTGKILKIKVTVSNSYSVALIKEGTIVDYKIVKGNNEFKFDIKRNGIYKIQILKQGYQPKLIVFDTGLAIMENGSYKFHLVTELTEDENKFHTKNSESKITIISFDPKKRWFNYNTVHSSNEKAMFYKARTE